MLSDFALGKYVVQCNSIDNTSFNVLKMYMIHTLHDSYYRGQSSLMKSFLKDKVLVWGELRQ